MNPKSTDTDTDNNSKRNDDVSRLDVQCIVRRPNQRDFRQQATLILLQCK